MVLVNGTYSVGGDGVKIKKRPRVVSSEGVQLKIVKKLIMIISQKVSELPSLTGILEEFESFSGLHWHQIDWALFRLSQQLDLPNRHISKLFKLYRVQGSFTELPGFVVQEIYELQGDADA